ncbi:uncharacterized protein F5891DRAFT_1196276 [Suillus fuscotomentosus]|uniref:G domain-containing protein n=1 Tax=Suillus fuscotomentosus TaxID=1912939 RepID=A0AAD4HDE7_9AGAM|nr:uncharacterized protein F5891DRAFT_1196276 [Suillus fuscotomentosus]KAG1893520.1 hypothetical protein F5891DRAFT_1196276 [Suillus fuscotomentosus]
MARTPNETLKVKLVDTAGLDEGPRGTVPDKEARRILKKLLRTLMQQGNIHLVMYCVRAEREIRTLRRNYELIRSQVKRKVPIVLVVTCLESYQPNMEDWWKVNKRTISNFGMTFADHACITTAIMTGPMFKERRTQSYDAVCKLIEHCRPSNNTGVRTGSLSGSFNGVPRTKPNTIVVFGAKGAGKSSLINLMAGKDVAGTSCSIRHCTDRWKEYPVEFGGEVYRVFDTVGLCGESYEVFNTAGANGLQLEFSQYLDAIENAYNLVQAREKEGGIGLLVFCVSGAGKLNAMHQNNYRFFHEFLCGKKVPIVLAITNLERELDMEKWWTRNQDTFCKKKILVNGHACITAIQVKNKPMLQEKSRNAIWNLVKEFTADGQKPAWKGGNDLFVSSMSPVRKDIVSYLTKRCHMPLEVAKELASKIKKDIVGYEAAQKYSGANASGHASELEEFELLDFDNTVKG